MFPALYQFVALHVRSALVASPCRLVVVVVRLVTLCCCGDGCRTLCSDRVSADGHSHRVVASAEP